MKIAIVHPSLAARGGSQRYVIEIARTLKEMGMDIDIYCYEYNPNICYPDLVSELNIFNLKTLESSSSPFIKCKKKSPIKKLFKELKKYKPINKIIYSLGIDCLYSFYIVQKQAKDFSCFIKKKQINYDIIYAHEEPLSVWAAIHYKKKSGVPIYWFCYDTIEKWFLEWNKEHKNSRLRQVILKNIFFKYDKFKIRKYVDLSSVLDKKMEQKFTNLYDINPLIRRGGISNNVLKYKNKNFLRKKYNLPDDKIILFCLSRFLPYKRIHDIFEFYRDLPDEINKKIFIYINAPITDMHYYEDCKIKYKDVFKAKNIVIDLEFPINDEHMYNLYLSSDIFLFPNENQTWGHAPLEAMACGTSVVISNGCGIHEIIKKITPHTIFNTGDINQMSRIIEQLIENNNFKTTAVKQKKYVEQNLTWHKICAKFLLDFQNILEK
ncbi:MAG: glycosyltransferase family 4 protein [Rhodomicrobiaceae bacterium]